MFFGAHSFILVDSFARSLIHEPMKFSPPLAHFRFSVQQLFFCLALARVCFRVLRFKLYVCLPVVLSYIIRSWAAFCDIVAIENICGWNAKPVNAYILILILPSPAHTHNMHSMIFLLSASIFYLCYYLSIKIVFHRKYKSPVSWWFATSNGLKGLYRGAGSGRYNSFHFQTFA